jgi:hypothetical protein
MSWRGFGFVHHSRTLFCRGVPNPNVTIRNFLIAVRQAMGLGCCMASYSLVARKCQYSGIAPAVYQQLDVRFLGMMDNMTTQCSLPTKVRRPRCTSSWTCASWG